MSKLRERVGDIDCKAEMGTLLPDESHTQLSDALGDALDAIDELGAALQRTLDNGYKDTPIQDLVSARQHAKVILTKHGLDQ